MRTKKAFSEGNLHFRVRVAVTHPWPTGEISPQLFVFSFLTWPSKKLF